MMHKRFVLLMIITISFAHSIAWAGVRDFDRYHSQEEINAYLFAIARDYPELAKVHAMGFSQEHREINALVLSPASSGRKPALYFNGTHHGNEKSSTEAILALVNYFVTNQHKSDVANIFKHYALVFQPLVNPDGHAHNVRTDAQGRDPNRNYAGPGLDAEKAFTIPETALVSKLLADFDVRASIAFHSGMEGVLWPWGFTEKANPEQKLFAWLGKKITDAMGYLEPRQSFHDYPTTGEYIDYAYMSKGTLAFTVEVSREHTPETKFLPTVMERATKGTLAMINGLLERENSKELARLFGPRLVSDLAH